MADNQGQNSQSDQQKLAKLEQQLSDTKATDKAQPAAAARSGSAASTPSPRVQPAKTGMLWFFTLLNILLVLTLGALAYLGWLQWQQLQQQNHDSITGMEQTIAAQQNRLNDNLAANQLVKDDWQAQNAALQNSVEGLRQALADTQQQATTNQAKLSEIAGRRPADWLLAEADYLVKMAGRKLWLEHDVNTAILMLQAADSRIEDLAEPNLLPLRQKLAADIQRLQQIPTHSGSSVALQLSGLSELVDDLPLAFFQRPEKQSEPVDSQAADDWQSNLMRNVREVLDGFFSFKKITAEVKPFMSEEQQWLAKERLKFTLLKAQIAILNGQSALFQDALHSAKQQLNDSYQREQQSVVQFAASLDNLLSMPVQQQYPDSFAVSAPLRELISQRLDSRFVTGNP